MRQDVTIELDFDDETWSDLDVLNDKAEEEDEDDIIISDPLTLAQVTFRLPGSVKIKHLSQEVRDIVATSLDVPSTVTIGTWQMVVDFLSASESYQGDLNDPNNKDVWKPFKNLHAQVLINALHKVERIDILARLKEIVRANCHLADEDDDLMEVNGQPQLISAPIGNVLIKPFTPINATKIVLVLHYETTEKEKENYKWFWKNFSAHLEQKKEKGLTAMDVKKLKKNDGGNIIQMVEHVWPQFPHIVVCFNDSYIKALRKSENAKLFQFIRSIHRRTDEEFVQNDNRNLRCRCVIMPGTTERLVTNWAMLTHQYLWPENYNELIERILDLDKVKVTYSQTIDLGSAHAAMQNVTL